jgi:hypothetical protein
MSNYINNINTVLNETNEFLHSTKHWSSFETLAIVEGVLRACFNMVYCLAPDKKTANSTIKAVLKLVDDK